GFARGERYYGYLTGFHPAHRKLAPGKCLLLKRIDVWNTKDSVQVLDFLSGDESYKTSFTRGECYEVKSYHWMPNRVGSRARRATLVAERFGRRVAKQAISKIALSR
ncbi:MAG: GNAT family N-acetyltransferase, partial [Verrucomicrobiota bacterium]